MGLTETDRVFEWSERAFQERDTSLLFILIDPVYDYERTDPQIADLLRSVGLRKPSAPVPKVKS
jgi:hypothetical protein